MSSTEKKMKFEEALKKLEKIVEELETGEITLDKTIQKFEEGMKLVKFCSGKLNEVQKKVEIIVKDKKGRLKKKPFGDVTPEEPDEDEAQEDSEEDLLF